MRSNSNMKMRLSIRTRPIMYSQRCRTWSGRLRQWAQCARLEAGRARDVGWGARRSPRRTRTSHCSRAHIQWRTTLQNVESTRLTVNCTCTRIYYLVDFDNERESIYQFTRSICARVMDEGGRSSPSMKTRSITSRPSNWALDSIALEAKATCFDYCH